MRSRPGPTGPCASLHSQNSPDFRDVLAVFQALSHRPVHRASERLADTVQSIAHPVVPAHWRVEHIFQSFHFVAQTLNVSGITIEFAQILFERRDEFGRRLEVYFLSTVFFSGNHVECSFTINCHPAMGGHYLDFRSKDGHAGLTVGLSSRHAKANRI